MYYNNMSNNNNNNNNNIIIIIRTHNFFFLKCVIYFTNFKCGLGLERGPPSLVRTIG